MAVVFPGYESWLLGAWVPWLFSPSFFPPLPLSSLLTDKQVDEVSIRSVFLKSSLLLLVSGI